jgi:hypothetical protein
VHEKVCKNAYLFKVTPPNVCGFFKNKADFVEVVRMDEKEIAEIKWAIELIDDYVREPNSISAEWYKVLKLCRRALRERAMKESK